VAPGVRIPPSPPSPDGLAKRPKAGRYLAVISRRQLVLMRESGGMADAPDLGSGAARRGGSSPPSRTILPFTKFSTRYNCLRQRATQLGFILRHLRLIDRYTIFFLTFPTFQKSGGSANFMVDSQILKIAEAALSETWRKIKGEGFFAPIIRITSHSRSTT